MNGVGAGYTYTLFLLKNSLHQDPRNETRLVNMINTAKWYNDFGNVYQSKFEFKGTTADSIITILLFRLMIVLAMPATTEMEKKERQRDMDALKKWIDNALCISTKHLEGSSNLIIQVFITKRSMHLPTLHMLCTQQHKCNIC